MDKVEILSPKEAKAKWYAEFKKNSTKEQDNKSEEIKCQSLQTD